MHFAGVVKADTSLYEDALSLFQQVLRIDPSHIAAKKHLENVQQELRNNKGHTIKTLPDHSAGDGTTRNKQNTFK